ncbi:MAG: CHAT domain-containing protein, partial [Planctomycetota bacterium]|nr:CHAT domain-containing protein [Planctomycetota bacterium]
GTAVEVRRVGAWLAGRGDELTFLTGAGATEAALEGALRAPRVLHLATHGIAATPTRPYEAALALSLPSEGDPLGDGFLTLDELIRGWGGRLDGCELVTLSACDTQTGVPVGESLVSLPWGFLHAGAQRVLVSLWSVDDRAALLFMDRFYGNWCGGIDEARTVGGRTFAPGAPMPPEASLFEAKRWLAGRAPEANLADLRAMGLDPDRIASRSHDGFPLPGAEPRTIEARDLVDFSHPRHWAAFVLVDAAPVAVD